jgi:hypothetical protein
LLVEHEEWIAGLWEGPTWPERKSDVAVSACSPALRQLRLQNCRYDPGHRIGADNPKAFVSWAKSAGIASPAPNLMPSSLRIRSRRPASPFRVWREASPVRNEVSPDNRRIYSAPPTDRSTGLPLLFLLGSASLLLPFAGSTCAAASSGTPSRSGFADRVPTTKSAAALTSQNGRPVTPIRPNLLFGGRRVPGEPLLINLARSGT